MAAVDSGCQKSNVNVNDLSFFKVVSHKSEEHRVLAEIESNNRDGSVSALLHLCYTSVGANEPRKGC